MTSQTTRMRSCLASCCQDMENYKIIKQLGKGAQATNHLAESRAEPEKKCVLKKVECFDESEANKAFRESRDLLDLSHPYVSGYKEFFVMWEKEDSSMHMVIAMEYFPMGELQDIIEYHRQSKAVIPEEKIKYWLGQIIEGLVYVHQRGLIHRDIKPSNLYVQEDGSLKLGDFAVATVMSDIRTCTRATQDIANYMAPEVCSKGFSEASDIWSLGCILFELTTATLFSSQEVIEKLKEIKEDSYVMEMIFEDVAKEYSGGLISLIRSMLSTKNRPTAVELLKDNKYIASCVHDTDATQLEKRKRQKSARLERKSFPRDEGILKVLEYLALYVDYEDCVQQALDYVLELCKQTETFSIDASGKRLINIAMRNSLQNELIQITGCNIYNRLIVTADTDDVMYTTEIIRIVPRAMEEHANSVELQQVAAATLMALASCKESAEVIGDLGGVSHILNAMRKFPNNPELCAICCHALWSLSCHEDNVKTVTEEKGLKLICDALRTHMNSAEVAEAACAAMMSATLSDENFDYVGDLNCVGLLINAIDTHAKNAKVVKNACLALASLVEPDEESAYLVLTNDVEGGSQATGILKVIEAYNLHKDNAEVVESVATLIMELTEYDDVRAEMRHLNVGPCLLSEIFKRFKENPDIMNPCEKALQRLQAMVTQKVKQT